MTIFHESFNYSVAPFSMLATPSIWPPFRFSPPTGNLGISRSLGGGISELKIDYGPGYRLYYTCRKQTIIWLLCGGNKSTQQKDISKAKKILAELEK